MAVPGGPFRNQTGVPTTPFFAEVVLKGTTLESNGSYRPCNNVFHFRRRSSVIAPVELNLIGAFKTAIETALGAAISEKYIPGSITARFMDDPSAFEVVGSNSVSGAITGDRMPSGNGCVTCQIKTNGRGRNFTGSKHFSPIAESDTVLDQIAGGAITRWDAVASAIQTGMNAMVDTDGNTWDLIVLSQNLSDLTAYPARFTGAYMLTCTANLQIGTMKRRRQKAL